MRPLPALLPALLPNALLPAAASFIRWFAEEAPRHYGETMPINSSNERIITIRQPVGVVSRRPKAILEAV